MRGPGKAGAYRQLVGICADIELGVARLHSVVMRKTGLDSFEEMRVELAALRLIIRAILTFLACRDENAASETLAQISGMLEGNGPYAVIADDLDSDLRQEATELARVRTANFIANISKLPIASG